MSSQSINQSKISTAKMNTNNKKHDNNRNITSIFKLKKKICTLQNIFINIDKYHHSITRNK